MEVTTGTEHGFFLKPLNNNPGVREFLCASPFIYADGNELRGIAFQQSDAEAKETAELNLPGLSRFRIVDLLGKQTPDASASLKELLNLER